MSAIPFLSNAAHAGHIRRVNNHYRRAALGESAEAPHEPAHHHHSRHHDLQPNEGPTLRRSHSSAARLVNAAGAIQKHPLETAAAIGGIATHHHHHRAAKTEPASPVEPSSPTAFGGRPDLFNFNIRIGGAMAATTAATATTTATVTPTTCRFGGSFKLNSLGFAPSALRNGVVDALQSFGRIYSQ